MLTYEIYKLSFRDGAERYTAYFKDSTIYPFFLSFLNEVSYYGVTNMGTLTSGDKSIKEVSNGHRFTSVEDAVNACKLNAKSKIDAYNSTIVREDFVKIVTFSEVDNK